VPLSDDKIGCVAEVEGHGRLVILAHGWAGAASQFRELKAQLLGSGFRVATFDAPAHGASPGKRSNAGQFARLIAELDRQHGPTLAVVGHSLGGLAAAMSSERVKPLGLVLICPMPSLEFALDQYQSALGFGACVREQITVRVEREAQVTRDFGNIEYGLATEVATLLIHDETDKIIPVSASRGLKQRFQHLQYLETRGLGHSRLLRDADVLRQVTEFVKRLQAASV
jgi:pimeloyl-ACP methyl ester carboxylesterase